MSFGLRSYRARRRRAIRWQVVKVVLVLCGLLAAGMFAYEGGSLLARQEVFSLEKQVKELNSTLVSLEEQNTELKSAAQSAKASESEWQRRYKAEVPQGRSRELYDLLHDRLAAGIEADRLAFVIGEAKNPTACDGPTQTKRFLVKTPLYEGANDSVSFDREAITVTAEGATATNAQGNREAWFNPAEDVTVSFTEIGGRTSTKTGKLPLHHAMVIGQSEYRFTVLVGARGFINVTGARCKFP